MLESNSASAANTDRRTADSRAGNSMMPRCWSIVFVSQTHRSGSTSRPALISARAVRSGSTVVLATTVRNGEYAWEYGW